MDKRLINFMLVSMLVIIGYMQITMVLFPPEQPVDEGEVQRGDDVADVMAQEEPAGGEIPVSAEVDPINESTESVADSGLPREEAELKRFTIGSVDPTSGHSMLVTFISQGAAVERIELSDPRYRDLEDKTAYVGHLAVQPFSDAEGVRVTVVGGGTPAAKAGIQPDDVIVRVGDRAVNSPAEYLAALRQFRATEVVPIEISGSGRTQSLQVTSTRRPLEVIRPEPLTPTVDEPRNQLSYLLSLHRIGPREAAFDETELSGVPSLRTENWHAAVLQQDGLTKVEFRFPLGPNDLKAVNVDGNIELIKRFWLKATSEDTADVEANYHFDFEIELVNKGTKPVELAYRLDGPTGLPLEGWWYSYKTHPSKWGGAGVRDVVWRSAPTPSDPRPEHQVYTNPMITKQAKKHESSPATVIVESGSTTPLGYVGIDAQYFNSSLLAMSDTEPSQVSRLVAFPVEEEDELRATRTDVTFRMDSEVLLLRPDSPESRHFQIFAGPKKPSVLANYGLDECIVYGWFWWAAKPMGHLLHGLHAVVRNYGIAIILLTFIVRACMFPLGRQMAMNAKKMQELAPEIKKIKEKYPKDMEKQTAAQQELFRKHKYNPLAGCLPMFVQLPIFIGLYKALSVDIELRQTPLVPGLDWCANLAAPDMLWRWDNLIAIDMLTGYTGWLGPYLNVLPVISMGLFLVHQQMFTPPPTDEQQEMQQKVMKFMTLFIGVLFFKVPSGLCLYFITSSLWALCERLLLPKNDKLATEQTPVSLSEKKKTVEKASVGKADRSSSNGTSKKNRRKKNRR